MKWAKMSFEEIAKSTMVKWMSGKVKKCENDGMEGGWNEDDVG